MPVAEPLGLEENKLPISPPRIIPNTGMAKFSAIPSPAPKAPLKAAPKVVLNRALLIEAEKTEAATPPIAPPIPAATPSLPISWPIALPTLNPAKAVFSTEDTANIVLVALDT